MEVGHIFNPFRMFTGAFIPNVLIKYKGLSFGAKILWARLAQYAGEDGICYPSLQTLAEECCMTKRGVIKALKQLAEQKFIKQDKPKGIELIMHKTTRYYFLWHECFEQSIPREVFAGSSLKEVVSGSPLNIKENHIKENHKYNIYAEDKSSATHRRTFLENVLLSEEEHNKLTELLGKEQTNEYITRLNDYIHQIGKQKAKAKYKSHYHVILNWHRKDMAEIERRLKVAEALQQKREEEYFK